MTDRIRKGIKNALLTVLVFCLSVSLLVFIYAPALIGIFVRSDQTDIIRIGAQYLRIEGACYFDIGLLFLLYGFYRAVNLPGMSDVLTVASLSTRVVLAYVLSAVSFINVTGIWVSVPIGWFLADMIGCAIYIFFISGKLYRNDIA